MTVKFLHASDLHIGKPFGRFDEHTRARLKEGRHAKIAALAQQARLGGASIVLLAGDTFDAETPPPAVVRQTIRALAAERDITWVMLPGNHDSLAAGDLWQRIRREQPENLVLALEAAPIEIPEAIILPAPPMVRHPGRDLTEWMDQADTGDVIRIGLAHGAIQGFSEDEAPLGIIAPNRAERAGLDYLGLGDWHGQIRVSDRCWYSGTPEPDSFKPHALAGALLVEIAARGARPNVTSVETGQFAWCSPRIDFRRGDDPVERLEAELPAPARRRDALVSLRAVGRLGLSERAALATAIADVRDDFAHFEEDLEDLDLEQEIGDLDRIDRAGALRTAAEALIAASENPDRDAAARKISRAALARLYGYAQEQA